jgi:hypothetical protein
VLFVSRDPERISAQLLHRQPFKILRHNVIREGDVQLPGAKCAKDLLRLHKDLLRLHHVKVDVKLWICALECPKSTGKDHNSWR